MEEMLLSLNGPWSNAACIGYCVMAMRNAGLSEKTQRKVLDELTRCFDDVSVEDAGCFFQLLSSLFLTLESTVILGLGQSVHVGFRVDKAQCFF